MLRSILLIVQYVHVSYLVSCIDRKFSILCNRYKFIEKNVKILDANLSSVDARSLFFSCLLPFQTLSLLFL